MTKHGTALLALAVCLGGCGRSTGANNAAANSAAPAANAQNASANSAAQTPGDQGRSLALTFNGLQAVERSTGHSDTLRFGSSVDDALRGLTILLGGPPSSDSTNGDCGAGPMRIIQWSNGFQVMAQDNKLQGWEVDEPGIGTADGLQVGSTRAQLDPMQPSIAETSLGHEFTIGDGDETISGLLSSTGPDGRVTAMWSGVTCHAT